MSKEAYEASADKLVKRIMACIPGHPEILDFDNPFQLFKVDGFKCDDIGPSLFQAQWSLSKAKQLYRENGDE